MKTSEQTSELSTAIAKAAAKFPKIERGRTAKVYPKDKEKPAYSYDYADLDDVLSAVRGPLAENGITISHDCKVTLEPLCVQVTARLDHQSGQWKESEPLPIPCEGNMSAAQQIGSASTYGKRYTAQNILGISTEADDDGNAAANHDSETGKREKLPDCPDCKTNKSVIVGKPEYGGGFVCFGKKGGCGAKWQAEKAKEIAEEHGLTTADKLEPPKEETVFEKACKEIAKAASQAQLDKIEKLVKARNDEGKLTPQEYTTLADKFAEAALMIDKKTAA